MPVLGDGVARAADPAVARSTSKSVSAVGLELVTLTEDSAVVTWYTGRPGTNDGTGRMEPVAADGHVDFGTRPDRLNRHAHGGSHSPYHHVEITGLEPGRTYYYQARSRGVAATPTPFTLVTGNAAGTSAVELAPPGGPYSFTTTQPPPGRYLFSIALCNDLHLGETVAGLVGGLPGITGIAQAPGHPPYPEVMARALVADARARGAQYLLAAGDISAEAVPTDLAEAKSLLDGFGTYRRDYFVARGNHDRAHSGAEWATCRPGTWQGNDCYGDAFLRAGEPSYFATDLQGLHVVGLDTYDKPGNGGDAGGLSAEQLAWVQADLAAHAQQPTLVFGHHPLVVQDSAFPITVGQSLQADQAAALLQTYAATPGVFFHHAGHTHRNAHTTSPLAPRVTLQEVSAGKEYPGGFALVRFHTGGYALNFYKTRSPEARAWSERSRQEIYGLWPQFALGRHVSDRNYMVRRDFSGLRRAR
jgi:Icc protein